jgi:hypothetical protein
LVAVTLDRPFYAGDDVAADPPGAVVNPVCVHDLGALDPEDLGDPAHNGFIHGAITDQRKSRESQPPLALAKADETGEALLDDRSLRPGAFSRR